MASNVRIADGSLDFSGGIDSGGTTTVQTQANPNGLPRTMLAWLTNATVRGGGIEPRTGWQPLCTVHPGNALFQGGFLYEPAFANPYLMLQIGGRIFQVRVDTDNSVVDVTGTHANPPNPEQAFFCQAEQFLIIQPGDFEGNPNPTAPLFWDGASLRRSVGIISANNIPGGAKPFNELPPAGPMCYYQGRVWYAQDRVYTAGDIVGDQASGTAPYDFKDSVLKVTENPLATGGDGFTVPDNAGNIRALAYSANLNTQLGQGPLYVFTRKQIYSLVVPVSRADWIAADANNQPLQTVVQRRYGAVGDRCVVPVNGDLFYQSLEPAIRSLFVSIRNDDQWGNVPLSRNENRVLQTNDRALMRTATGIQFDNRLWQAILPVQTPVGVGFQAVIPLDFDIISEIGGGRQQLPPAWEGIYEGLDILQLFEGDFGGRERAFAVVHSRVDGSIQVWEMTDFATTDNGDNRINWFFETPAFNWNQDFELKQLDGAEMWIDSISGTVEMKFEYRVDADPCWQLWHKTRFCAARNSCEDQGDLFCGYPQPTFCEGYKFPITLPAPQPDKCATMSKRPVTQGYQFQMRVTVKGWCRVRGFLLFALPLQRPPFEQPSPLCE